MSKPRMGTALYHNGSVYDVFPDGKAYQLGVNGEIVRDFEYSRAGEGQWVMGSFHLPVPPSLNEQFEQVYQGLNGK